MVASQCGRGGFRLHWVSRGPHYVAKLRRCAPHLRITDFGLWPKFESHPLRSQKTRGRLKASTGFFVRGEGGVVARCATSRIRGLWPRLRITDIRGLCPRMFESHGTFVAAFGRLRRRRSRCRGQSPSAEPPESTAKTGATTSSGGFVHTPARRLFARTPTPHRWKRWHP